MIDGWLILLLYIEGRITATQAMRARTMLAAHWRQPC